MTENLEGEGEGGRGEATEDTLGQYEGGRNELNERHGKGTALLPNGDMYDGHYRHGKRHGTGFYVFRNGARYNGDYKRGVKHGTGTFSYPDGSIYQGEWRKDKKHGFGKYIYSNGDTYEGSWYKDVRDGIGTYMFKSINVLIMGTWVNGRMNGPAQVIYPPFRFLGEWKNGLPLGKGAFTFQTNSMQLGGYVNVKDPELIPGDSAIEEEKASEPLLAEAEEIILDDDEIRRPPLPKGIVPIWKPKSYIPYDTTKLPREPAPEERFPSPASSIDKVSSDEGSSLLDTLDFDDEGYFMDEDITEILNHFLDVEVREAVVWLWEQDPEPLFDSSTRLQSLNVLEEKENQENDLVCGPGTELPEDFGGDGDGEFAEMAYLNKDLLPENVK